MPLDASILGFSNRWYSEALGAASEVRLSSGSAIRGITAPYFLGTKLEAFRGRGRRDYFASHDLEDFIAVIDGRSSLLVEMATVSPQLREYVRDEVRMFLGEPRFLDALPGYLLPDAASQGRLVKLTTKLRQLTELC
jgi:hypothetical protein